jgi:hypothetical protein
MKYYFINNNIAKIALPQGYAVSTDFSQRHNAFVELTDEQIAYHLDNPTANVMQVYYVGNIPQPETILPSLEERKNELKAKFATKQIEIKQALITAEETVGSDNPTLLYLKTQLLNERVRIITTIDNFTTIDEAMAFDIRDEDAQPFMDALYNLINSI